MEKEVFKDMCNFFQTLIYIKRILYLAIFKMSLFVSKKLKDMMDKHPEINWSEVARQSLREKLTDLEFLEEFKSRSELTEEEAIELGNKVNESLRERYEESS